MGTATTLSWELAASYSVVACTVFARAAPTIYLIRTPGERLFFLQFLELMTELSNFSTAVSKCREFKIF